MVKLLVLVFIMLTAIDVNNGEDTDDSPEESQIKRLRREIFENRKYDKNVFPRPHHKNTTVVKFGIELLQFSLDERLHTLTTEAYYFQTWSDHHLPWKEGDFGGMDHITLRSNEIWKPDIFTYNVAGGSGLTSGVAETDCIVYSSGQVVWIPAATVKTLCNVDLKDYPFDEQVCKLIFGSWTTHGNTTDLKPWFEYIRWDGNSKGMNPEFETVKNSSRRVTQYFPEWDPYTPFHSIHFSLTLRRRTSVYTYVIVIPWIVATLFMLAIYVLSPLSLELRKGLAIVSNVTFLSLLLFLGYTLGFASLNVPTAVKIISLSTLISGLSLLWSIAAYNLALRDSELPHILKVCIDSVCRPCLEMTGQLRAGQSSFKKMNILSEVEEGSEPRAEPSIETKRNEDWLLLIVYMDRFVGLFILILMLIQHA